MGFLTPSSLTLALTVTPFLLADAHFTHSTPHNVFRHRRQTIPALPGNWSSLGCHTDNVGAGRTLNAASFASGTAMTIESCINFCNDRDYIYAGTEYGAECYCDNFIKNGGASTAETDCNMRCSGNTNQPCGSGGRLNLFTSGGTPPPPPVINPGTNNWVSLGCYTDAVNGAPRTLPVGMNTDGPVTTESCTEACFENGYRFAGTEFANECFCGTSLNPAGAPAPAAGCNMVCGGNSSEFCGGPNRLNVYNYTGTDLPTAPPGGGGGGGGGGASIVHPVTTGLPDGWAYDACWVDNAHGRILQHQLPDTPTMDVQECIQACSNLNFTVAGLEFGQQCFCGPNLVGGAVVADEATCNMGCVGDNTQACGGPNRVSVYSNGEVVAFPVPTPQTTDLPGQYQYAGCLHEAQNARILPWMIEWPLNNSANACMERCAEYGYTAAGVEFGIQCFCGDITDVQNANGVIGDEADCNIACPADPVHLCGGGARLSYYTWQGDLNVWHTPAITGRYEFFMPGLIVPLIATVGINNKVTFLEKGGTGISNATGAYELDLSLVPDMKTAYREMHVKTDVFCAGSIILPDKAGRQLNVGGWSLDSTFGVRLYNPEGAPGVNGTNDWEEDFHVLSLQRGRWYPTAAVLANGSVVVIGGEIGSNDRAQPNLEILPRPPGGDTVVDLPWLLRTDPNNLYPFVIVLPSQNVFVGYWNEARILEPGQFNTIKELPNIPGSVNNFLSGRTYPLEGAAMPLPLHAPYNEPMEILICGGSSEGGGEAVDNCVTIQPEVPEPKWVIERMPSKRVLACMVALPDGTYMIMNGARQGVAGFGLANDPNLNAVLYDPTLPRNQRMSILNNTIVARMYHSEATLLPDGRVLISGSDPLTDNPDGTVKYPEEFRIEVYVPPYLAAGNVQPTFDLPISDWSYGGVYTITNVHLHQGTAANVRVSLIGATSSTHGNTMGARTIFPEVHCVATTCTITAPPNAGISPPGWHQLFVLDGPTPSHSRWVRIGGDPSQMGNWPNLPGFHPPGI